MITFKVAVFCVALTIFSECFSPPFGFYAAILVEYTN